jgi:hypothetical protein
LNSLLEPSGDLFPRHLFTASDLVSHTTSFDGDHFRVLAFFLDDAEYLSFNTTGKRKNTDEREKGGMDEQIHEHGQIGAATWRRE